MARASRKKTFFAAPISGPQYGPIFGTALHFYEGRPQKRDRYMAPVLGPKTDLTSSKKCEQWFRKTGIHLLGYLEPGAGFLDNHRTLKPPTAAQTWQQSLPAGACKSRDFLAWSCHKARDNFIVCRSLEYTTRLFRSFVTVRPARKQPSRDTWNILSRMVPKMGSQLQAKQRVSFRRPLKSLHFLAPILGPGKTKNKKKI